MPALRQSASWKAAAAGTRDITSYFQSGRPTSSESTQSISTAIVQEVKPASIDAPADRTISKKRSLDQEDNNASNNEHHDTSSWNKKLRILRHDHREMNFERTADGKLSVVESSILHRDDVAIRKGSDLSNIAKSAEAIRDYQRFQREARTKPSETLSLTVGDDPGPSSSTMGVAAGSIAAGTSSLSINRNLPSIPDANYSQCFIALIQYIQLVKSASWPYNRAPDVIDELNKDEMALAQEIADGWHENLPRMAMYGKGWEVAGRTWCPPVREVWRSRGIYFDFLQVAANGVTSAHTKVYGGMASNTRGYSARVGGQHQSQAFRDDHPCYHYVVMDTPGTISDFRSVATYPPTTTRGIFLLSEGYLIAAFGLCENRSFVRIVACLGMPAMGSTVRPLLGINRNPGLAVCWDAVAASEGRDSKSQKKAMELITTGYPVSIHHHEKQKSQRFMLLHQHFIKIPAEIRHTHPQILNHDAATIYIDLSFGAPHHTAWYNIARDDEDSELQHETFQQFGIWLQLKNDTGFWLLAELHPNGPTSNAKCTTDTAAGRARLQSQFNERRAKHKTLARMICEVYSLNGVQ